jgi:hypothetical protein
VSIKTGLPATAARIGPFAPRAAHLRQAAIQRKLPVIPGQADGRRMAPPVGAEPESGDDELEIPGSRFKSAVADLNT